MTRHNPMRGEEILAFIERFRALYGYAPSRREIMRGVGLHSPSAVQHWIKQLEADDRIERTPGVSRGIPFTCPNCGHSFGTATAHAAAA